MPWPAWRARALRSAVLAQPVWPAIEARSLRSEGDKDTAPQDLSVLRSALPPRCGGPLSAPWSLAQQVVDGILPADGERGPPFAAAGATGMRCSAGPLEQPRQLGPIRQRRGWITAAHLRGDHVR